MRSNMEISPDLVEWIVADDKVASHWVSLARRIGLSSHIAKVQTEGRRYKTDKHKLAKIIRLWREESPDTYTVKTLKSLLAAEGLNDMFMWISMMSQDNNTRREELAEVVYRKLSCPTPNHCQSPCQRTQRSVSLRQEGHPTISPMGRHLYSPPPSSPYSIYFSSQTGSNRDDSRIQSYSRSFYGHGESPYNCFDSVSTSRQSTPDSTSRPTSRLSDYGYINPSHTSPTLGLSCPGTPLQRRTSKKSSFSRSPALERTSPLSSNWSGGPSSSLRNTRTRSSSPAKGIYDLLYRPDLIKMSSPYIRSRQSAEKDDVFHRSDSLVIDESKHQHSIKKDQYSEYRNEIKGLEANGIDKSENQEKCEQDVSYIFQSLDQGKELFTEKQILVSSIIKDNEEQAPSKPFVKKIKFENSESEFFLSENSKDSAQMALYIKEGEEPMLRKNYAKNYDDFGKNKKMINRGLKEEIFPDMEENKKEFTQNLQQDYNRKLTNQLVITEEVKKAVEHQKSTGSTIEIAKQNIDAVIEGLQNIATIQQKCKHTSNIRTTSKPFSGGEIQTHKNIENQLKKCSPQNNILKPKTPDTATVSSPRKGGNNTMDTYFDNLIILLDEAAEGLNV